MAVKEFSVRIDAGLGCVSLCVAFVFVEGLVIAHAHEHCQKKKDHLLSVLVRVLQPKIQNKKYIACIYEEIYCYKMENKLKSIIILKKVF